MKKVINFNDDNNDIKLKYKKSVALVISHGFLYQTLF